MSHGPAYWLPTLVQPLGTVLIGIAGAMIALRQWLTASEKFRFELFEKRFEIYQNVAENLSALMQQGDFNINLDNVYALDNVQTQVRLFFGSAVARSVRNASISAKRLKSISQADIQYQLEATASGKVSRLFYEIVKAGTSTVSLMETLMDFSRSGMPTEFRLRRHFSTTVRGVDRMLRWFKARRGMEPEDTDL